MELNEKHIELVGLYIQGSLKGEDLASFLEELKQNPSLRNELDIQQAIHDGIEHKNNLELRERFKKISAESKQESKGTKILPTRIIKFVSGIAAALLLCLAVYFLMDQSSNTDTLFAAYFEPSELTITRSTDMQADLVNVKELYNSKKYKKALPFFETIIEKSPTSSNLRLAYGNNLLACGKIESARDQFNYIINSKDPLFSDQSRWYLALLELKEGKLDEAKALLERLSADSNSDFHTEAIRLLEELAQL